MEDSDLSFVKVGDTVGVRSGTGVSKKVYKLVEVERLTPARIVADRRQFYKYDGREVGGIAYLEVMTPKEIADWKKAKAKQAAEAEARLRNYDPRQDDDHVQAALRSLRDKARSLCEKLQTEMEHGHTIQRNGPVWKAEFLALVGEIEQSENALKSFGVSTTLKSHADLCSIT